MKSKILVILTAVIFANCNNNDESKIETANCNASQRSLPAKLQFALSRDRKIGL
jgi:hypothetical protein